VGNFKLAVVTGGSSGIGYAIAQKLTKNNIRSVLIGRDPGRLKLACSNLGELSEFIVCDLTRLENLPGIVRNIIDKHGKIDILVNNAGIHLKKKFSEVTDEEYLQVIMNNQNAVFTLTREVTSYMVKKKSGTVLNISSMASQYGLPGVMAYTASKSAIEGMTRAMAVELSPSGIRVNCIAPGFIKSSMSSNALDNDPDRLRKVISRTPMGRLGTPEEVAEAAFFLVSEAASFITGVVLPVDGGNSIGF
jgi:NAD(P)-dependent dehydrogenase (short-subunit alcohol dehydrogenase family)